MENDMEVILNRINETYWDLRGKEKPYLTAYEAYAHLQESLEALWNAVTAQYGTDATYRNAMLRAAMDIGAETVAFIKEVC
jgi:hypothetical protein